ncbi:hypothetical protein HK405_001638 [Cladochytrium tenue]|nr:hypothetical protein HK405_001638 [Cladochytrium tenue]
MGVEALDANGGDPSGWYIPPWSITAVGTVIFSVTAPGPCVLKDLAAEIQYALDVLRADGVVLFSRCGDDNHYLGHPAFAPVWRELSDRGVVSSCTRPTRPANPNAPLPLFDYPHETGRAAMDLVLSGTVHRSPGCKIVLSHAGGTLLWLALRMAAVAMTPFSEAVGLTTDKILEDVWSFYFDLALSTNPVVLPTLLNFAKEGHVLFGCDYPNAPESGIQMMTGFLDNYDDLDEAKRREPWSCSRD